MTFELQTGSRRIAFKRLLVLFKRLTTSRTSLFQLTQESRVPLLRAFKRVNDNYRLKV